MKEMGIIDPNELYTPLELEQLKLIPSRTMEGRFASRESILKLTPKQLKITKKKESANGKTFTWISGQDVIDYLKKYHPDYEFKTVK